VGELDGIVEEFLVESHENLDRLDRDLVQLEAVPDSPDLLAGIFRTVHTLKGSSGFLAFGTLERLAHAGESLLAKLRDGDLALTPARTDALLELVDAVRTLLAAVERTGTDDGLDVSGVVARLEAATVASAEGDEPGRGSTGAGAAPRPAGPEAGAEAVAGAEAGETDPEAPRRSAADSSIRVDVAVLDSLVRLVGELVLARNELLQHAGSSRDGDVLRSAHRLDLVSAELQEVVMRTRLQSMDYLWSKLPRMVRDLASQCGKQVQLVLAGRETELDRTLLDAVKDPLTHLVRNAVDHGIEAPEARRAAGKPATGTLAVRAYHASGQVVLEVVDDGRGIDPGRVLATAVERGIVTAAESRTLSPSQAVDLVLRRGFSTAPRVTTLSGRGVGMDVVRTDIEAIGGTVDLHSEPGRGCVVRVTIPLTLAIIPALVVRQDGQRYAVPQAHLVELVRPDPASPTRGVEHVAGAPVHRLRGALVPLVDLGGVLGTHAGPGEDRQQTIVVLRVGTVEFGLTVDEVLDTQEIVVKPLTGALAGIPVLAGAAVMGDGGVALILDVPGLAAAGRATGGAAAATDRTATAPAAAAAEPDDERYVLLRTTPDVTCAVPLAAVDRLEEAPAAAFERLGGTNVLQYRGDLLPLVDLTVGPAGPPAAARVSAPRPGGSDTARPEPTRPVVVCRSRGRALGLSVTEVVDIVAAPRRAAAGPGRAGTLGTIVVDGRVTEVLDVDDLPSATGMTVDG
jgi:two-component system chemotaxis sensor kinase CheA